jgi:hypothetical protein
MKKMQFIIEFMILLTSQIMIVKSMSNLYRSEARDVGIRATFHTKFLIETVNNVASFGKCINHCTKNNKCESGEYNFVSNDCFLLSRMPNDSDIIAKTDAITFYRGICFKILTWNLF